MSDPAIVSLQEQLAHLDRRVDQLNDVVTQMSMSLLRRDRQIDRMEQEIKRLRSGDDDTPPPDEKPPHY